MADLVVMRCGLIARSASRRRCPPSSAATFDRRTTCSFPAPRHISSLHIQRHPPHQLRSTRITESPLKNLKLAVSSSLNEYRTQRREGGRFRIPTHILLMNRSLFRGLPFLPLAARGVSVHISLTFSSTMLQCRSNALTRASSLRLLRHEMRTWVCERTAVWRMESGPVVNSYSSSWEISYSLCEGRGKSASVKGSKRVAFV